MSREKARCKFWDDDRGYGFLRCEDGTDIFVHTSSTGFLPLSVGDRVSFERGTNPRTNKPEAKAVAVLENKESEDVERIN